LGGALGMSEIIRRKPSSFEEYWLGSPIAAQTAAKARAARSTYARVASASARAVVRDVQASGVTTLKGIAAALQARGIRTPRGNVVWAPAQVARLLA
jgi:hypothetical protein